MSRYIAFYFSELEQHQTSGGIVVKRGLIRNKKKRNQSWMVENGERWINIVLVNLNDSIVTSIFFIIFYYSLIDKHLTAILPDVK